MKTIHLIVLIVGTALLTACTDRQAAEEKARQDAEAKARADAERKEMDALPKTFKPRYNKRLDDTDPKPEASPKPANP